MGGGQPGLEPRGDLHQASPIRDLGQLPHKQPVRRQDVPGASEEAEQELFAVLFEMESDVASILHRLSSDKKYRPMVDTQLWVHRMHLPRHIEDYNRDKLMENYIDYVLKFEAKKDWLETYFEPNLLQRRQIIVDLESGKEPKNMNMYFIEFELINMRSQKYLKLEDFNKKRFEHGENVEIHLKLKNVQHLTIKTFEINTQSYYRKHKAQFKEDIDLDGLIPSSVLNVDLSTLSPLAAVKKTIEFPYITERPRGIFVIEFVGGGFSSRAVIRKGGLTLIKQPVAKGIVFNVVNNAKEVCIDSASMLLGGKSYKADANGDILIPYTTKSVNEQAVVIAGDFADIVAVTIPSENYAFLTSLMFNEEALVPGNIAQLIIHPKLIFNGRACSISYVKKNKVIVNSTNDAGVKSSAIFSDVTFSYEKDTVINYLVPPKLKQIEVVCQGQIILVDGTEINVSTNEFIELEKKSNTDLYFDVYLRHSSGVYYLHLLGKNGESLPDKVILVNTHSKYLRDNYQPSTELKTDERGIIKLGPLIDISSLTASFQNSGLSSRTWNLEKQKTTMHIQYSYQICLGEELVLPTLGAKLSRTSHQLCQYSLDNRTLMSDAIASCSEQDPVFAFKFEKTGFYIFKYLDIDITVEITVIQGERWKFSDSFVAEKHQLTKMISDLSYMTIESYSVKDNKVRAKINCNNPSQLKVHALGFTFYPTYLQNLHNTCRKMCPHYVRETFGFPQCSNSFMSEKLLGDEINYVLNRKNKPSYVGNTLEKPPVLLKRHYNKNTIETEEQLQTGQDFKNKDLGENKGAFIKEEKAKLSMPPPRTFKVSRISDFLANGSLTLTNIKANENGEIEFDLPKGVNISTLRLLASDVMSNASVDIPLTNDQIRLNDVRLANSKNEGSIYGASRIAQTASEGQSVIVKDMTNSETLMVDDLETVFQILKILSGYNNKTAAIEFDKWRFLANWENLAADEKVKYYDEFCGHELNIYLFFKDRAFFNSHVLKFLSSKSRFDNIDHIFLGHDNEVNKMILFPECASLTPIEMTLLVLYFREKNPAMSQHIITIAENMVATQKKDEEQFRKYFDTVLNHLLNESDLNVAAEKITFQNERARGVIAEIFKADRDKDRERPENMLMMKGSDSRNYGARIMPNYLAKKAMAAAPVRRMSINRAASIMNSACSNDEDEDHQLSCSEQSDLALSICHSVKKSKLKSKKVKKRMDSRDRSRSRSASSGEDDDSRDRSIIHQESRNVVKHDRKMYDRGIIEQSPEMDKRQLVKKKIESTKEYIERNYYFNAHASRSRMTKFWLNTMRGLFADGADYLNLDYNFIFCGESLVDMVFAMALLSLPSKKAVVDTKKDGDDLEIQCKSGKFILFCKQMNEKSAGKVDMEIIVSQRFYDPLDKYIYDEANPSISTLKKVDEFLVGKIYTSRVAVTNSSESVIEIEIICEIPQGAIPVNCLDYTKTYIMSPNPLQTTIKEFKFYFPGEGEFSVYPATAIKDNQLVTYAQLSTPTLKVVKKKTFKGMMDSITEILVSGSKADILAFLEQKNLFNAKLFNPRDIYWLMKDEKFFLQVVSILRKRYFFDPTIWAFSIYHGAKQEYFEYLKGTKKDFGIKYLQCNSFSLDKFNIKEYSPLTNPRTHNIGNKHHNIANKDFKDTYTTFLQYCFEKDQLNNRDRVVLCSYLVLQDRIEEALKQMGGVVRDRSLDNEELVLQLDYLTAYLSFYTEYPEYTTAKTICQKYMEYHIPTWRNRFLRIAKQLSEFRGGKETFNIEEKGYDHETRINKAEQLKVEIKDSSIYAKVRNVSSLSLSFYEIDIEILYSKDPFFNKDMTNSFNDVIPTLLKTEKVELSSDETTAKFDIPESLVNKNLVIYVQTAMLSEKVQYFPSELEVITANDSGFIRVSSKDKKLLPQIYVKAFSQSFDGSVSFYKDGYTDMRGIFDYSSLNADKFDSISRFSLLICSHDRGSVTKIVPKPDRFGFLMEDDIPNVRMLLEDLK